MQLVGMSKVGYKDYYEFKNDEYNIKVKNFINNYMQKDGTILSKTKVESPHLNSE